MAHIDQIDVEDVGTVRHLNAYQIRRLKRVRGPNKAVAPFALAAGLTYQQFRSLPTHKREEIIHAYRVLLSPANTIPPARSPIEQQPGPMFVRGVHRTAEQKAEIGRHLLSVKAKLPRGHFGPWLRETAGLTPSMARECMALASCGDRLQAPHQP